MARKLSLLARRIAYLLIVGVASLAANTLSAQSVPPAAGSPIVIDNSFISAPPQSDTQPPNPPVSISQLASEAQQKLRRPIAYQNPFTAKSKSPPVDTSLRPGPISRWRHPVIPGEDSSAIKSAMLSGSAAEPDHPTWDQLPPAETLRNRAAVARGQETDPTFFAQIMTTPNAIQFTPKPLIQPAWVTEFDEDAVRKTTSIKVKTALFDSPLNAPSLANQTAAQTSVSRIERAEQVSRAFSLDTLDAAPAESDVSPSIISNCVETAAGWLEQAQSASKNASSPEELSSIIEFCDRGLHCNPDATLLSSLRRLSAWAHNRRGELLADANRDDDALSDFQAAISLDPKCSLAIHNRAVTFAQQNQFDAALRDFNRVVELNPGLAVAYRNRAELLAALGRMEEAINDYNQALDSLPNDAQLYRDRACAYQQLGEYSKSFTDFNHALDIAPDDPDALTGRGNLAAQQGNYEQAQADFQKALTKNPNSAETHRSLAWLKATCPNPGFRDSGGAISAAESAAKLAPANDYLILETLAAAHASAGHFDSASEFQQQALTVAPPDAAPSLKQRLALYQHRRAYQNVATPTNDAAPPDPSAYETDAAKGSAR